MVQLRPMVRQHLPDEQSPVALIGLALAAEKREPMVLGAGQQPIDRLLKRSLLSHLAVESSAVRVVVVFAGRTATELLAEEEVPQAPGAQGMLQLVSVEVRRVSRVGVRANVDDELDALLAQ